MTDDKVKARHDCEAANHGFDASGCVFGYMQAKLTALVEGGNDLLRAMSSTFKSRNGREVGVEADDGEKCWIVHSDQIEALRQAVAHHSAPVGEDKSVKRTMTLNLTDEEMATLEKMATEQDLKPQTVFRQALRVYQLYSLPEGHPDRIGRSPTYGADRLALPSQCPGCDLPADMVGGCGSSNCYWKANFVAPPATPTSAPVEDVGGLVREAVKQVLLVGQVMHEQPVGRVVLEIEDPRVQQMRDVGLAFPNGPGDDGFGLTERGLEAYGHWKFLKTSGLPQTVNAALIQPQEAGLHPATAAMIDSFALALKGKLRSAELKYGHDDSWRADDWADKCRADLIAHVTKGDPRDVAAYAAFCWAHGWSTTPAQPKGEERS